ncbi:MAG: hypothetical protein IKD42_03975, partial [Kiritimatiellae bacterium]|nr:hypothetical protein [Kiritimatiellia bacterium]
MFPAIVLAAALTNFSGVVTFEREDLPFFFMRSEDGANWRVERGEGADVRLGDFVSVSGRREISLKNRLGGAEIKIESVGGNPPDVRHIELPELFANIMPYGNSSLYGEVLSTEGIVRDIMRRENNTLLLVGEGEYVFQVELPCPLETPLPRWMTLGATVKVTGALAYTS